MFIQEKEKNEKELKINHQKMNKELNVIGIAVESIKNDNLDALDRALRIMPLEHLKDEHENLLSTFLSLCAGYNRPEATKMILERWKVIYPDNDKISLFSRLFLKIIINDATLSYLVSIHPDYTYVELMDELCEFDASPDVVTACARADQIFGRQKHDTYKILRDHAKETQNFAVEEFIIEKMNETAPYSKKPSFIQNYLSDYVLEYKNRLPTEDELNALATKTEKEELSSMTKVLPSDNEAVEMLTQGLARYGISFMEIEATKKFLLKEVSSSEQRKRELLDPILENANEKSLENDRLLYWIFGPSNPLVDQDLTINAPSYKYGGCRMFLCDLFDYDEEFDYVVDWFTGNCQYCLNRIEKKCYSVRKPRPHGGWQGCYCSWDCVKKDLKELEDAENEPDLLTQKLIEIFEKKMLEIGIQDRQ